MSTNRILVDPKTPFGALVVETADALHTVQANLLRINNAFAQMVRLAAGEQALTDNDFLPLCQELGIQPTNIQQAKDLFYLIAVAKDKSVDPVLQDCVSRLDQAG